MCCVYVTATGPSLFISARFVSRSSRLFWGEPFSQVASKPLARILSSNLRLFFLHPTATDATVFNHLPSASRSALIGHWNELFQSSGNNL